MENLILLHQISIKYNLPSDISREIGEYYEIPILKLRIIQRKSRLYWLRTIEEGIKTCIIDTINDCHSFRTGGLISRQESHIIKHLYRFLKGYERLYYFKGQKRKTIIEMLLLYHRYSRYQTHRICIDKPYISELKSILYFSKDMGIMPIQYIRSPPSIDNDIDTFLNDIFGIQ